jgi:FkbM family methyltransferase
MNLRSYASRVNSFLKRKAYYHKNKSKLLIEEKTYNKLNMCTKEYRSSQTCLFDKHPIKFNAPFWFLHSLDEIFVEEVYRFKSKTDTPTILDCGSNIGLSILYFKKLYPKSNIIAFEPDPGVFKQLEYNIEQYGYDGVILKNAALWNKESFISFESEGSVGGKINANGSNSQNVVKVETIRLRTFLEGGVDFLKIDIEGVEYDVLKDCVDLLDRVENLFIEYHVLPSEDQHLHTILKWVSEAGFKYYIREAWNNMTYPYLKQYNDYYQMQLNIFCYR